MRFQAAIWATALLLAEQCIASPEISFPINAQVPPVARVGQPFSFILSPNTFTSDSPITYSLAKAPKWLSIDSRSRRLFGTPGSGDAGPGRVTGVPLELVASDDSGSTSMSATLVVARGRGPEVEIPFEKQPPSFGIFSGPSSVLADPDKDFSFRFDPETLSAAQGSSTYYYATMADNTPLPAWIFFDASSLSFSGRTPSMEALVQPPQRFSFQLVASDVPGFAGAVLEFDIVVGNHKLTADTSTIVLNATPGDLLSYTGLIDGVRVDGKPATPGTVTIASEPKMPSWLSLDKHTLHITGVPPTTATSTSFVISLRDKQGNTVNRTIRIQMPGGKGGLFTSRTPNLVITPGEDFSFQLKSYLANPDNTDVSIEGPAWIEFDPRSLTLSGTAPVDLNGAAVDVKMIARSKTSKENASLSFPIAVRAAQSRGGNEAPGNISNTQADGSFRDDKSAEGDGNNNRRFNPVLLAVLLPLFLLLGLTVFILFWCYRRQQKQQQKRSIRTRDISGPIPGSFVASSPSPIGALNTLPDFAKRFGKSFSADDVFGIKKPQVVETVRNASISQTDLAQQQHLRPGSTGPIPHIGGETTPPKDPKTTSKPSRSLPFIPLPSPPLFFSRQNTRAQVPASLSSITETSIGDFVDTTDLNPEELGKRSFRDRLELNVPTLRSPAGGCATHPVQPSPVSPGDGSRPGSARTVPAYVESSLAYPPSPGKRAWGWLRGVKGRGFGGRPKLVMGVKRMSERTSMGMAESIKSPVVPASAAGTPRVGADDGKFAGSGTVSLPQSKELIAACDTAPSTTNRPETGVGTIGVGGGGQNQTPAATGPGNGSPTDSTVTQATATVRTPAAAAATSTTTENPAPVGATATTTTPTISQSQEQPQQQHLPTSPVSLPPLPFPIHLEPTMSDLNPTLPRDDSLDLYDEIIPKQNPFRRSPTWSTVPTNADDNSNWVDETVSSLSASASLPYLGLNNTLHQQHQKQQHQQQRSQGQQPNWTVLQESSPVARASSVLRRGERGGGGWVASSSLGMLPWEEEGIGDLDDNGYDDDDDDDDDQLGGESVVLPSSPAVQLPLIRRGPTLPSRPPAIPPTLPTLAAAAAVQPDRGRDEDTRSMIWPSSPPPVPAGLGALPRNGTAGTTMSMVMGMGNGTAGRVVGGAERSGLGQKSRSMGIQSVKSEGSSYAVFI
ncbi:hypothetical protein VTJ04DRAFT_9849 [Mycothermus thermophilus]|uniref:uncharacterized protein n=1 Tax=Humicola insolens TaxID=85995 RepID=UPI003742056F